MTFQDVELSRPGFSPTGIHFLTFFSPALRGRGEVTIYLPAGQDEAEAVPLVLLLHGVFGNHLAWPYQGGAHLVAQRMIWAGEIRPMGLAMPSDGLDGRGTGYVNTPERAFEDWIAEDVPGCVAEQFPCFRGGPLLIGGLSMGGFGALRIGAKHPGRFRAVSGHSSATEFEQIRPFVDAGRNDYSQLEEGDLTVLYWMKRHRGRLPGVRFDCGLDDHLVEHNRALHAALEAENIPHDYREFPGAHTWNYWHEHLADTLRFFDAALSA